MIWFLVWTVLVLGACAFLFWVGRRLWRQAVALGRALGTAADVASRLADQVDELQRVAERPSTGPTLLADPDELRERVRELRAAAGDRRAERAERNAATARSWRAYWG
ncbi:hypothetical protein [Cellulomonas sp. HZM]|uniref:hypothetical protein n=1 Tax=Cellulomonas sp. HZM TaxID=1454010 RepID=UPI00049356FD|nr:hypothetical protein [Cellulomonas sp. HZM]